MGEVFYRNIDPSHMGYAQLRYYHKWHEVIGDTELAAARAQIKGM